ncbi:hypothetical protein GLAREA_06374 [Glarea lozoyensis ATCC 20868]|nr:uncharacterized protein GLAREA_06374 [Glarea lozoyensis ATCC 20868]EPE33362.1 hypothetical protein GLAREA_06374 [Glarea lozoyensis ATCC 20868]
MSSNVSRAVLRQSTKLSGRTARRCQSTTTKATEAAKDTTAKATEAAKETTAKASQTASEYTSKASEGLSRVTSSAGPAISGAAKGLGNALGKIGGRTGKLIAFVERQIPPTVYYARVGMELSKLVFRGQKMTPPPVSTFQSYFQSALKSLRNPGSLVSQTTNSLQSLRNMDNAKLISGGVVAAEVIGFFTVGEMIGRMKLVGYRGDTGSHH